MNIFYKEKQNKIKYFLLIIALIVSGGILVMQDFAQAQDTEWIQVNTNGFGDGNNISAPSIALFDGYLYVGTENSTAGGEVWRTANGTSWSQVNADGFGNANNTSITSMASFGTNLYAGTLNQAGGTEIWRCTQASACNAAGDWTQVASGGFGDANNDISLSMETFNGFLYVGTRNNISGAEVFRSSNGTVWNQINNDGFGVGGLTRIDTLESYNNALYAGSGIAATEIWRCTLASSCNAPGDWVQMDSGGFGDASNRQVDQLITYGSNIYAGTFRIAGGGEIWRSSNGSSWTEVVGDGNGGGNGFGDTNNDSMISAYVSNGYLYFGTRYGGAAGTEVWRTANGTSWTQVNDDGFGDGNNDIASAMIEFGSKLFVATHNITSGTEVWRANYIPEGSSLSAVQLTDGSGGVSVSISVDDIEDDNLQARVEYNVGSGWQKATISTDDGDTTATYGDPVVNNGTAYQLSSIITTSGANSISTVWNSATDVPTADLTDARVRIRLFDNISQSGWYTSAAFDLDNVAPNPPTLDPVISPTNITSQTISGGKDANVSVLQGGSVIVALNASRTWSYDMSLLEGVNAISLTSRDDKGNESSATTGSIVLDTVPPNTEADPPGGTYVEAFEVTLSADESGSTIYYTTDGSDPDTSSTVYTDPISVSSNATLKFFGVDSLGNQEDINEEVYVISDALVRMTKSVSTAGGSLAAASTGLTSKNNTYLSGNIGNFIKNPDHNLYSKLSLFLLTVVFGLFLFITVIIITYRNKTEENSLLEKITTSFKIAFYKNKKAFSLVILIFSILSILHFFLAYNMILAADAHVERGDILTYRIDYSNVSTDTAANFYFIDSIPSYTEYINSSMVVNGSSVSDASDADLADYNNTWPGHVYFNIGDLISRDSGYITFQVRVIDTAPHEALISNKAVGGYNAEGVRIESNTVTNIVQVARGGTDDTDTSVPSRRSTSTRIEDETEEIISEDDQDEEVDREIEIENEVEIGRKSGKEETGDGVSAIVEEVEGSFFDRLQNINKWIAAPSIAVLGLLNLITSFSASTLLSFLRYLWQVFTEPLLYFGKRKRKGWGVVYNSQTKEPVDLALVRLYDQESKKLIETKVTDFEGRYVFIVEADREYYIEVSKQGFSFPSNVRTALQTKSSKKLYYGDIISFAENKSLSAKETGYINYDIPLDQKEGVVFNNKVPNIPIKTEIKNISQLEKASYSKLEKDNSIIMKVARRFQVHKILGFIGPILGFVNFIITPSVFTFALLILHLLLVVVFIKLAQIKDIKPFGRVYNLDSDESIAQSVVRLFDQKYGRLLSTTISKSDGRYGFLLGEEKYLLNSNKTGYVFPAKKIQVVGDKDKIVRKNLGMKEEK